MNRKRRMQILIDGDRKLAEHLAQQIEGKYSIEMMMEPQHALTMIKMRETAKQSLFYLGEVLVTECKVKLHNVVGTGVVVGDEYDFAYQLAIIDAAFTAHVQEVNQWITLFEESEKAIEKKQNEKRMIINKTKVNFETMDV